MAKTIFFAFFFDFLFMFRFFFVPLHRFLCPCVCVRGCVHVSDDGANRKNNHFKKQKDMKNFFLKLSTLLILFSMSVNAAWGQEEQQGQPLYIAALQAQVSDASTGAGSVKLTWVDAQGEKFTNALVAYLNDPQKMPSPFATGNPSNGDEFAATASIAGATMTATESIEESNPDGTATMVLRAMLNKKSLPSENIYMTPFAYFKADAEAAEGSYFYDWTFIDPKITRQDTAMDKTSPESAYFKVLPDSANVYYLDPSKKPPYVRLAEAYSSAISAPNNIYAVFKKYLLSNPIAYNGKIEEGATAELEVAVEINGDATSLDVADFAEFTFSNNASNAWSYNLEDALDPDEIEVISAQKTRIYIPVTYTYPNDGYGVKNTTMTIRMAGENPSTLNVNLSVEVLDPNRPEAFWFDGKAEKKSGDLADMLNEDISTYANPILKLNKSVEDENGLTFSGKTFTLDLNGNHVSSINIESGEVTFAYSKYGGDVGTLNVSGGKAILNGGEINELTISEGAEVEQNGAIVKSDANNAGTLIITEGRFEGGLISSGALTVNGGTFTGNPAITVEGDTAVINRGTIGFIYDEESELAEETTGLLVTGGEVTIKKLAAIMGTHAVINGDKNGAGTINIECGKFDGTLDGTINFTSGYFKNAGDTVGLSAGKERMLVSAGVEYSEGYRYFLGTAESALANGVGVCRIGEVSYAKLEDAIAFANNNPTLENLVIFMTNNYTLPAGYYTIPANTTLVVPMDDNQPKEVNKYVPHVSNNKTHVNPYIRPYEYRCLTFANGVNMDVFGSIEVTCTQYADENAYTSQPYGPYGHIVMEEGSHITLMANSELRAWGFITGKGEMDARRNSKVREMFQLGDWKGAFTSVVICGIVKEDNPLYGTAGLEDKSANKVFPVTQYWIQNIESPVKYHPGSVLATTATVTESVLNMPVSMTASDILIIGVSNRDNAASDQAIFLLDNGADADNTWIRKWYDAEKDIQVYEINSAAHIGSMELDMGEMSLMGISVPIKLNSALFDLPLTSNFKIHLLSGTMDFQQNTCLLPGTEVEVDKEATVTISMTDEDRAKDLSDPETVLYSGAIYVYDQSEWDKYAFDMDGNHGYTKVVRYSPSWEGITEDCRPNIREEGTCPKDAEINVKGTFDTDDGYVYTTVSGANIFSTNEDAGTFIFRQDASEAGNPRIVRQVKVGAMSGIFARNTEFVDIEFFPAKLKNGDGTYEASYKDAEHYAKAGDAYCYQEGKWSTLTNEGCFMVQHNDVTGDIYYAKPQEYVAVIARKVLNRGESLESEEDDFYEIKGNEDHTYSDADGAGRLFILADDCQWWEVEKRDNLYHCLHPNNDTYYYWKVDTLNKGTEDEYYKEYWAEKRFTITWKDWEGEPIMTIDKDGVESEHYSVTYGTMAEFFGTNPTREKDADSTYNFTGWKPALGPVTQDVTYTATFKGEQRKYTIIFQNEGGLEIERQFLTHNEVPVCENMPTKVGHILQWSPAIGKVVADATYVANWLEEPPTKYEIRFVDYDGRVLKSDSVEVGSMPTPPAYPSNKPETKENTYTCSSWDAEVVAVTEAATYTAVYTPTAKTFTVIFRNEDNSEIERHDYAYGETPVCSATPTKPNTAEFTYSFAWEPQIETVMDDAIYTATFPSTKNKYTVTLKADPSGACTFTGAGTFDYGTIVNNVAVSYEEEQYEFQGWSDLTGDAKTVATHAAFTLTEDITIVANFRYKGDDKVTITWMSEDGETLLATSEPKVGSASTYTGATPTKPDGNGYTYTFDGWMTEPNGAGEFYKNYMTPKATEDATYYAHFAATESDSIVIGIDNVEDLNDEVIERANLIITSNGIDASGQLLGAGNLNITGEAVFRMEKSFAAQTWYAVAVPWTVALSGIRDKNGSTFAANDVYVLEFDAVAYASADRANGRNDYWHFLHLNHHDMKPGKLYMIWFREAQTAVEFHKTSGEIWNTETSVATNGGTGAQDSWNGIANPALYHANLNVTVENAEQDVLKYNGNDSYVIGSASNMIVGEPVFVQVTEDASVVANIAGSTPAPYRRALQETTANNRFVVELTQAGRLNDRMIVQTAEEKADTYVIGKDLAKMGVSALNAQMWINRYDAKLCKNTVALQGEQVEYPLNISAPQAGGYVLSASQERGDATLYLTHNGEVIWNLSEGDYVLNLEQGTTANYGLRISIRKTPTGIDEAVVEANGETKKVLVNDKVFIIRGEKVYSIDGRLVK